MTLTLDITQADIDGGVRGKCGKCPIALAFRRKLDNCVFISVTPENVIVEMKSRKAHKYVGAGLFSFVVLFDTRGPSAVQPCTLTFAREE